MRWIKALASQLLRVAAIGEHQPAQDPEQLTSGKNRIPLADWFNAMDGLVAKVFDQPEPADFITSELSKVGGINQISKGAIAIGAPQLAVVVIDPLHQ